METNAAETSNASLGGARAHVQQQQGQEQQQQQGQEQHQERSLPPPPVHGIPHATLLLHSREVLQVC